MTRFFGGAGSGRCLAREVRAGRSAAMAEGLGGLDCGWVMGILISKGNLFLEMICCQEVGSFIPFS
jgi:hypothetical protein